MLLFCVATLRAGDDAVAKPPSAPLVLDFHPFECGGIDVFAEPGPTLARMVLEKVQQAGNVQLYHVDELEKMGRAVDRPKPDFVVSGSLSEDFGGYGGWMLSVTRRDEATGAVARESVLYVPPSRARWDAVAAVAAVELFHPPEAKYAWYLAEAACLLAPPTVAHGEAEPEWESRTLEAAEKLIAARRCRFASDPGTDDDSLTRLLEICEKALVKDLTEHCQSLSGNPDVSEKVLSGLYEQMQMLGRMYQGRPLPREFEAAASLWRRRRIDVLLSRPRLSVYPVFAGLPPEYSHDIGKIIAGHAEEVPSSRLWNYRISLVGTRSGGIAARIYVDNALIAERLGDARDVGNWLDDWLERRARYWQYMVCDMPGKRVGFKHELRNERNIPYEPETKHVGYSAFEKEYVLRNKERFYIAMEANVPFFPLLLYLKADGDIVQLHPADGTPGKDVKLIPNPRFPDSASAERGFFLYAEPPFGPETIKVFGFLDKLEQVRDVDHRALVVRSQGYMHGNVIELGDVVFERNDFFTDFIRIRTVPAE